MSIRAANKAGLFAEVMYRIFDDEMPEVEETDEEATAPKMPETHEIWVALKEMGITSTMRLLETEERDFETIGLNRLRVRQLRGLQAWALAEERDLAAWRAVSLDDIAPYKRALSTTGVATGVPTGWAGPVAQRSGTAGMEASVVGHGAGAVDNRVGAAQRSGMAGMEASVVGHGAGAVDDRVGAAQRSGMAGMEASDVGHRAGAVDVRVGAVDQSVSIGGQWIAPGLVTGQEPSYYEETLIDLGDGGSTPGMVGTSSSSSSSGDSGHSSAVTIPKPPTTPKDKDGRSLNDIVRELQKLDMNVFDALEDDTKWPSWWRNFVTRCKGFGFGQLVDPNYIPPTNEQSQEYLKFRALELKMSTILLKCCKTQRSEQIFYQYQEGEQALNCIRALHLNYNAAFERKLNVQMMRDKLEAVRMSPGYKDGYHAFLIKFETLLSNYHERASPSQFLTDNEKRVMLERALNTNPTFAKMVKQTFINETNADCEYPWPQYMKMLTSYAIQADSDRNAAVIKANVAAQHGGGNSGEGNAKGKPGKGKKNFASKKTIDTPTDYSRRVPSKKWSKLTREQQREFNRKREATSRSNNSSNSPHTTVQANVSQQQPQAQPQPQQQTAPQTVANTETQEAPRGNAMRNFLSSNVTIITSQLSSQGDDDRKGATVDRGANGGIWGGVGEVVSYMDLPPVSVNGVNGRALDSLPIVRCAAKLLSTKGPVIGIFENFALKGTGSTILSCIQLEDHGVKVDDKAKALGGKQQLKTADNYIFPLVINNGLAELPLEHISEDDWQTLDQVQMTSAAPWDPSKYDSVDDDVWNTPTIEVDEIAKMDTAFSVHELNVYSAIRDAAEESVLTANELVAQPVRSIVPKRPNYEALRPNFAWISVEQIKATLANSTQFCMAESRYPMRRHFKSRFPAMNVKRLDEVLATDTLFSEVPALDDGIPGHANCTQVQLYVGKTSHLIDVFPMKAKSDLHKTLQDFIRKHGAPLALFSDGAKEAMSEKVNDILRTYNIRAHMKSEPYQQNQNFAERTIGYVKDLMTSVMDRTGAPAELWLLCLIYITTFLQHVSHDDLGGKSALQYVTGQVPDISPYLHHYFYEPVMYLDDRKDPKNPSQRSQTRAGRWCGPDWNTGDHLTYFILDEETRKVVSRSVVMSRRNTKIVNRRLPPLHPVPADGEPRAVNEPFYKWYGEPELIDTRELIDKFTANDKVSTEPEKGVGDGEAGDAGEEREQELNPWYDPKAKDVLQGKEKPVDPWEVPKLPRFGPDELMNRQFLYTLSNGDKVKARVAMKINDYDAQNHQHIKFLLKLGDDEADAIIAYTELSDIIEAQGSNYSPYKRIIKHSNALSKYTDYFQGSRYNVKVELDDGTTVWEPLNEVFKIDPDMCERYAREVGLLQKDGWKYVGRYSKEKQKKRRLISRKAKTYNPGPKYKFGVKVPNNWREARRLEMQAGHSKWTDAEKLELKNLEEYKTFKDLGKGADPPEGYKKINVHFVYDCKHDLRHRARLVAGGHMTAPTDEAYSSVVSLKHLRLALVIGELNGLVPMSGDIGNAYLEAYTKEKVYFVAGPEFHEKEGHVMVIDKALYGLRTSGARFHERLADALRAEGFKPSLCDPDLWLRDAGNCYEYIAVWVDDLMCIMKDPAQFYEVLEKKYKFKLKGVGQPEYHLGGDFGRDTDGTLYWSAKTYVKKVLAMYERLFDGPPKKYSAPLDKNDGPELDNSEELNEEDTKIYQSLVGALQWAITLGRFDISAAVASLSRFRAAPRKGHLDRVKRVCGYLRDHPDAAIRFRTNWPKNETLFGEMPNHDWMRSVYGEAKEDVLDAYPQPKGKPVRTSTFEDASLMHCRVTGKSLEGIVLFVMQTPVEWHCKLQNTVETATFGSEFGAAKQATDMTISLRASLMAMGVPLESCSWLMGDNKSVITQSTIPSSVLTKRHNALAYHRVRWAVAAGIIKFVKVKGNENIADPLTKFLPYAEAMPVLKPVLFWAGDTRNAIVK